MRDVEVVDVSRSVDVIIAAVVVRRTIPVIASRYTDSVNSSWGDMNVVRRQELAVMAVLGMVWRLRWDTDVPCSWCYRLYALTPTIPEPKLPVLSKPVGLRVYPPSLSEVSQ